MPVTTVIQSMTGGEIAGWGLAFIVLLLSLIQISPLKLNPWDRALGWLGKKLNGAQLAALQKQVNTLWIPEQTGRIASPPDRGHRRRVRPRHH